MVYFLTKASSDIIKIAAKSNTLQRVCTMSTQTPKELRIPVPWGHIAAKSWNSEAAAKKRRILGLHGWLDNANTFDPLGKLLGPDVHFVALDFFGHGLSSHIPQGFTYNQHDMVYGVRKTAEYLDWSKFDMIGHSLGGTVSLFTAAMFPEMVDKIVSFDQLNTTYATDPENLAYLRRTTIEMRMRDQEETERRVQSRDALAQKLASGTGMSLESANTLLQRGTTETGNGLVYLTRDSRLRSILYFCSLTPEEHESLNSRVESEVLLVKAKNGDGVRFDNLVFRFKPINSRKFEEVTVEGGHHVHLDHVDRVIGHVTRFLKL